MQDHLSEDPAQLLLKYAGKTDFDLKLAVQQVSARQKAKSKIPSWTGNPALLFPKTLSMEQASSEETAKFKSTLVKGKTMIDLTGGFGVDTYFISQNFDQATYCERQEELALLVKHNFEILSPGKFQVEIGDSLTYLEASQNQFDLIFIDPARRGGHNEKRYKLADCEPDIVQNWELMQQKAKAILVKASPMLDIKQAISELPDIQKVWVIAVKNEVKEILLLWEKVTSQAEIEINSIDLHPNKTSIFQFFYEQEEATESEFSALEELIIEPMGAILKAGAFRSFGERFGLKKLHPNSHLYTSRQVDSKMIPGRVFKIIQEITNPKKELKTLIPNGKINVLTRNYALSAEELKKKYKLKDGGNQFLIGTKVGEKYVLLQTELVR